MSTLTVEQIQAIKDYRNRTGCSLKEARRAIVEGAPPDATTTMRERTIRECAEALDRLHAEFRNSMGGPGIALASMHLRTFLSAPVGEDAPPSRPPSEPTRRCNGHCHCHAGPDGFMHPPCCEDCSPSRPSSEPVERAALIDVCRILRSEGNEVDKADAAYQRAQEALASAPASSHGDLTDECPRGPGGHSWAGEVFDVNEDTRPTGWVVCVRCKARRLSRDVEHVARAALAGRAGAGKEGP